MTAEAATGPVAPSERIELLDVLRGVAVLGILLANMPYMSIAATLADPTEAAIGSDRFVDRASYVLVRFFADTKFITIFSTLFGAGLGIMSARALASGAKFGRIYSRRLLLLLLFGLLHGLFLWFGDILTSYALIGFAAIFFRKRATKTILVWAAALFALDVVAITGLSLLDPSIMVEQVKGPDGELLSVEESVEEKRLEYSEVFASGEFGRMIGPRAEIYTFATGMMTIVWGPRTLALFLLGLALSRFAWSRPPDSAKLRRTLKRVLWWGAGLGVPLQVAHLVFEAGRAEAFARAASSFTLSLGGVAIAAAYASAVALWCGSDRWISLRSRFAAVGRMAFTNYLMQSAITAVIFNYAGLFDRVGRGTGLILTLAIFGLQLIVSPLWLARFRMGPLEWIWRRLTYLRPVAASPT